MEKNNDLKNFADDLFLAASAARSKLQHEKIEVLSYQGVSDPGRYYFSFSRMIYNRVISLYDDSMLLLSNDRIPAACVLARCILETYAIGEFSLYEVNKNFEKKGIDEAGKTVLAYINSSRIKVEEQKRFNKGDLKYKDYYFTKQAINRMKNEEAASKHILNALRHFFKLEIEATGKKDSVYELTYEKLSEWTHPSQTSLFHAFAQEAWLIETSIGLVSLWDGARVGCAQGLHLIAGLPNLVERMEMLATALTASFEEKS